MMIDAHPLLDIMHTRIRCSTSCIKERQVGQPTRNLLRCHHSRQVALLLAFEALLDARPCS
jgi:hypothetical protein